jgi:hypothetical protein
MKSTIFTSIATLYAFASAVPIANLQDSQGLGQGQGQVRIQFIGVLGKTRDLFSPVGSGDGVEIPGGDVQNVVAARFLEQLDRQITCKAYALTRNNPGKPPVELPVLIFQSSQPVTFLDRIRDRLNPILSQNRFSLNSLFNNDQVNESLWVNLIGGLGQSGQFPQEGNRNPSGNFLNRFQNNNNNFLFGEAIHRVACN